MPRPALQCQHWQEQLLPCPENNTACCPPAPPPGCVTPPKSPGRAFCSQEQSSRWPCKLRGGGGGQAVAGELKSRSCTKRLPPKGGGNQHSSPGSAPARQPPAPRRAKAQSERPTPRAHVQVPGQLPRAPPPQRPQARRAPSARPLPRQTDPRSGAGERGRARPEPPQREARPPAGRPRGFPPRPREADPRGSPAQEDARLPALRRRPPRPALAQRGSGRRGAGPRPGGRGCSLHMRLGRGGGGRNVVHTAGALRSWGAAAAIPCARRFLGGSPSGLLLRRQAEACAASGSGPRGVRLAQLPGAPGGPPDASGRTQDGAVPWLG